METMKPNPLSALIWVVGTILGAAVIVSLLLVVLVNIDTYDDQPVPAGEARWEALFTAERAALEGPARIEPGTVELKLVNTSAEPLTLVGFRYADEAAWEAEQGLLGVGEDMALARDDPLPGGLLMVNARAAPSSQATRSLSMTPGFYIFDWVETDDAGTPIHVWRIGAVEVVGSG